MHNYNKTRFVLNQGKISIMQLLFYMNAAWKLRLGDKRQLSKINFSLHGSFELARKASLYIDLQQMGWIFCAGG
jgi:hypothetical protein